jgi:hypothetical protein
MSGTQFKVYVLSGQKARDFIKRQKKAKGGVLLV